MTDNDIIKALECCGNWESAKSCEDCPANIYGFGCAQKMAKHTLDLINRQKAEIERLTKAGKEAVNCFTRMETLYKIKCKELEIAKSEAIKEFAERFKDIIKEPFSCGFDILKPPREALHDYNADVRYYLNYRLNNLVKEMVGDNNGKTRRA